MCYVQGSPRYYDRQNDQMIRPDPMPSTAYGPSLGFDGALGIGNRAQYRFQQPCDIERMNGSPQQGPQMHNLLMDMQGVQSRMPSPMKSSRKK